MVEEEYSLSWLSLFAEFGISKKIFILDVDSIIEIKSWKNHPRMEREREGGPIMTDLNPLSMGKGGMIIHSFLKIKEISIQFEILKHRGLTQTLDLLEPSVWLLYTV